MLNHDRPDPDPDRHENQGQSNERSAERGDPQPSAHIGGDSVFIVGFLQADEG